MPGFADPTLKRIILTVIILTFPSARRLCSEARSVKNSFARNRFAFPGSRPILLIAGRAGKWNALVIGSAGDYLARKSREPKSPARRVYIPR